MRFIIWLLDLFSSRERTLSQRVLDVSLSQSNAGGGYGFGWHDPLNGRGKKK